MSYNYVVTAQKPTAVSACVTGNFTSISDLNLVIARCNYLEIYLLSPEGLKPIYEINLYGNVAVLKKFRFKGENKDLILIMTSRYNAMILECIKNNGKVEIITKAHGNVTDRIGKPQENSLITAIDPEGRVLCLHQENGHIKLIGLEKNKTRLHVYSLRLDETEVYDIDFLYGCSNPTIILLYGDENGRHVKSVEISLLEMEFVRILWRQDIIENEASMVIPVQEPLFGVLIIGQESIIYHNGVNYIATSPSIIKWSTIICYARVNNDGSRYVLGDMAGHLFMLFLERMQRGDSIIVKDLKVALLGEITIPECITYLDNSVMFIGSRLGDSQLIKLNSAQDENRSYVNVMETYTSLAPIVDMVVVDLEKQGQDQLVTCSGAFKEGSLRIIRVGIGIQEHATVDLGGIKGIWALSVGLNNTFQNTIVTSFVGQTRVLSLNGEEVEETEIPGFLCDYQTFYSGNVNYNQIVQVTSLSARLISVYSKELLCEWKPYSKKNISCVSGNMNQVLCATGCDLYYLEIGMETLILKGHITLPQEVACLDISPLQDESGFAEIVAVGLWTDISARILKVPTLEQICAEYLGGEIIPRSILLVTFEDVAYLLCAMGDGSLLYFIIDRFTGLLSDKRKMILGTQPTMLRKFKLLSTTDRSLTTNVFATSDHPTVIYSSNNKLIFSKLNLKEVNLMCSLHSINYPDSLVLVTASYLTIGSIDDVQKLHIRTIHLGEAPRRIAHQEVTQTFGVITMRVDVHQRGGLIQTRPSASTLAKKKTTSSLANSCFSSTEVTLPNSENIVGLEQEVHNLLILDQHSFEVLHSHELLPNEYALSLVSTKLGEDPDTYYIVGTAFVDPEDSEPKQGRIVMFQFTDGKLLEIAEKEIKGACYSLVPFNGKLLASINSTVRCFEFTYEKELRIECSYFNNVIALYLKTKGDSVLIGDLMRSLTILKYRIMEGSFEEVSRNYNPHWMTAVEIIDDETFLGAENHNNIFLCNKASNDEASEEERLAMRETGNFHVGDMINVFRHGSLVKNHGQLSTPIEGSIIYGTVNGAIGLITQLNVFSFELLEQLEEKLSSTLKSVGKIEHKSWRSFITGVNSEPSKGFIDGDLIEKFLNLSMKDMSEVAAPIMVQDVINNEKRNAKVDDIIKTVEDLARIH
uniref:DNA damage-binding protein 1 n=2 Tax=Clastoptera arizonana TaxID=38151 RepID=A0A1B6DPY2_9HEMI